MKGFFVVLLFVGFCCETPVSAQTGIAAVVNDDVVSKLDFERRLAFAQSVSEADVAQKGVKERVLRQMIDERLKRQDASLHGVSASESELKHAVDTTMRQNGTSREEMEKRLAARNIPFSVLEDQIEADLLFVKTIRKTAGERSAVSDAEVLARLKEMEGQIKETQYLLSEIVLPVDNPEDDGEVYGNAVRLVMQMKKGVLFEDLAKEHSKSPSAARGGLLGWVPERSLEPAVREELALTEKGQISTPVRTKSGYAVFALRAVRSPEDAKEKDAYHIAQIFIPPSSFAVRSDLMKKIEKTKGSCQAFISLAQSEKNTPRADLGTVPAGELPPAVLNLLESTPLAEPTVPVPANGGELVFMACSKEKMSLIPTKEEIRAQIETKRLEMTAERRLRELRRKAITEIRI